MRLTFRTSPSFGCPNFRHLQRWPILLYCASKSWHLFMQIKLKNKWTNWRSKPWWCFETKNSCMYIILFINEEKVFKSCFNTVLFYWEEQCSGKEGTVIWGYLQTIIAKTRFVNWTQVTKTQFVQSQELILISSTLLSCSQNAF